MLCFFHLVDHALLGIDERGKFGQEHLANRRQVALALQHAGESREVGLQPVLFVVAVGGEAKIINHGVDVIFELGYFSASLDLYRTGQVAFGDGGRDFSDGADLVGEVVGEQVDVTG